MIFNTGTYNSVFYIWHRNVTTSFDIWYRNISLPFEIWYRNVSVSFDIWHRVVTHWYTCMSYQQAVTVYRTPRRFHRRSLGGPSDSGGLPRQWPPRWCGPEGARTRRPPVCWSGTGTCWLPVVCFWSPSILCKVSYIYMCIQYLNKSSKQLLVLHEYTNPHRMKVIYSVKLFIKKIKIRCINNTWNNFYWS